MSLGGITDYLRANNISIPQDSSAGTYLPYANQGPYEDIMAQMRASGGRGGSGGAAGGGGTGAPVVGATGGYDPNLYSRLAAARTAAAGSGVIPEFSSVGPGSRGLSSEQRDEMNDPNAWRNLSDAQKANYYANNPTMAKFVQGGQKLFGYTTLGGIQKFLDPEFVQNQELIARGITPNATSEINTGNTVQDPMQRQQLAQQLGLLQTPGQTFVSADPTADAADAAMRIDARRMALPNKELAEINAQRDAENLAFRKSLDAQQIKMDQESGYTKQKAEQERLAKLDSYYTGVTDSGGFAPVAAPVVAAPVVAPAPVVAAPVVAPPPAAFISPVIGSDSEFFSEMSSVGGGSRGGGGWNTSGGGSSEGAAARGGMGFGGTGSGLAKGGQVSTKHLQGPNPAGPDQGYGALKAGEFVINDKAVAKYGIDLMNAINSGKISKGKLRGLLEM